MRIKQTIGNKELWRREKTLFLTSRRVPIGCYGKVFRWVEEFVKWGCAVCFNTSELEEEVLKALLVCHVPTTLVVTAKFNDRYNVQIEQALKENRLLILVLQPEESDGKGFIARLRNQWAIGQVQHIVCGYINPNGSIFGLLAGHNNVTHLLDRNDIKAAESMEKPTRWTVAEDKRLLRMFYEDMGIHAIHRAIGRPYSTIYQRIKSLTMNDEVLKGREFEDYVVELLDIPHNDRLTLKEWRGDKSLPGVYAESNSDPDLVLAYDNRPFAIECKWRSHLPDDITKELLTPERITLFLQYSSKNRIPVFLLVGIGGLPSDPDMLFLTPVSQGLTKEMLCKGIIQKDNITDALTSLLSESKPNYIQQQKAKHPCAYAQWSADDDAKLKKLHSEGKTIEELVAIFHRNRGGIMSRLRKLNLL